MAHHTITNGNGNRPALAAPVRNRYFYGKLLDAPHLDMEQRYFVERGRLLNRLALGSGVLCGLQVRGVDAETDAVFVGPGVAIDGLGREIVVDRPFVLRDPFALTDTCGRPTGEVSERGPVVLCLAYHECLVDPAPVLVADCEVREECVPGAIRERFRLLVLEPDDAPAVERLSERECRALFGTRRATAEHLCRMLSGPCTEPHGACVPLALLERDDGGAIVADSCGARTTLYSNAALLDLILCLAARVEECCGDRPTTTGPPVVRDLSPGPQEQVDASVLAERLESKTGIVAVTFDRAMADADLQDPDPWLRAWGVVPGEAGDDETVVRVPLVFERSLGSALDGGTGFTAIYGHKLTGGGADSAMEIGRRALGRAGRSGAAAGGATAGGATARVLTQIRAADAASGPVERAGPQLLDADFAGTGAPDDLLDKVWAITATSTVAGLWDALPGGAGSLPSGDGTEGGRLHSYFEVTT
jgi:hypothetical protein